MTKPVTLDDLTRAELLRFVKGRFIPYSEADLLRAQWDEATEEWRRLEAAAAKVREPLVELARAVDMARGTPNLTRTMSRYAEVRKRADDAETKAVRAWNRAEKLYQRLDAANAARRHRA